MGWWQSPPGSETGHEHKNLMSKMLLYSHTAPWCDWQQGLGWDCAQVSQGTDYMCLPGSEQDTGWKPWRSWITPKGLLEHLQRWRENELEAGPHGPRTSPSSVRPPSFHPQDPCFPALNTGFVLLLLSKYIKKKVTFKRYDSTYLSTTCAYLVLKPFCLFLSECCI